MVRTERLELSHLAAPEPKSGVSTNFTTSAKQGLNENARQCLALSGIWGGRRGSNPRHQEPQSCALPTELRPPYYALLVPEPKMAHPAGLEPATIRLEGGCSIQLSYGRFYLHSVRSADLKLRPLKKLFLLSHLTQQQAVLDKRGECYRGSKHSSTANSKKFQLDKGVTGAGSCFAFATSLRHARIRALSKSPPMVNQAS